MPDNYTNTTITRPDNYTNTTTTTSAISRANQITNARPTETLSAVSRVEPLLPMVSAEPCPSRNDYYLVKKSRFQFYLTQPSPSWPKPSSFLWTTILLPPSKPPWHPPHPKPWYWVVWLPITIPNTWNHPVACLRHQHHHHWPEDRRLLLQHQPLLPYWKK